MQLMWESDNVGHAVMMWCRTLVCWSCISRSAPITRHSLHAISNFMMSLSGQMVVFMEQSALQVSSQSRTNALLMLYVVCSHPFDAHCCHMGTAISFVIFDIRALWRSGLSVRVPGCQKITNDDLTRSGTGCFIVVPIWQEWVSKG